MSHYVIDSILVMALYPTLLEKLGGIAETGEKSVTVAHDPLLAFCHELFDILQFEFIFCKPCQDLSTLVVEAIDNLKVKEILCVPDEEILTEQEQWSQRYARNLDDEFGSSDEDEGGFKLPEYNVVISSESAAYLEFLHCVLRPVMDTYMVAGLSLGRLVGRELTERDLLLDILAEMKTQLDAGFITYVGGRKEAWCGVGVAEEWKEEGREAVWGGVLLANGRDEGQRWRVDC
ncbi:hypothetical protein PR048_033298 [Dryococelus australis]|uniref:GPAT/DHAPAT C-terminal domain-containing protein n=1 Tax=Dryococelus australis TaxID=614101 RepID=A0ABQ9FZW4_9NEOP|nr:hypothetical protein PR048_033298 [Dryococelus australis]